MRDRTSTDLALLCAAASRRSALGDLAAYLAHAQSAARPDASVLTLPALPAARAAEPE